MTNQRRRRRRPSSGRASYDEKDIIARIIPARNASQINSILIYARPKVGKTRLFATAAEIARTLIIDCEVGTTSIRRSKAEVYKLERFDQIDEVYWFLANKKHPYKFVAIDPITSLGGHAMNKVLGEKIERDLTADPTQITQQDWGDTASLMRNVITKYKELAIEQGFILLISAHERRRDTDDEDSDYDFVIGPDTQPAVKGTLMGQMDVIGRLYIQGIDSEEIEEEETRQVERRILFGPHEFYESGDRSDNLPRVMRQPTMKRIMDRINRTRREEE